MRVLSRRAIPILSPSPVAKQWERVAEGRVRALRLQSVCFLKSFLPGERALIRPSGTFPHATRGGRGNLGESTLVDLSKSVLRQTRSVLKEH